MILLLLCIILDFSGCGKLGCLYCWLCRLLSVGSDTPRFITMPQICPRNTPQHDIGANSATSIPYGEDVGRAARRHPGEVEGGAGVPVTPSHPSPAGATSLESFASLF
ncbi:hypothetical protein CDAR_411301 [Caerostris darwini]|uniref:Secreted protein n=1 Tax=Caerostris darwini TaxID=1538125 RepID=A0AAV4SGW8_9ARAC|nr:hypothetical protein CDAR_411301 [Caerostris darwini]